MPMKDVRLPRLWLGLILATAATTRVAYFLWYRAHDPFYGFLLKDALRNDLWARALAGGESFEAVAYYQAPGYAFFLGLVYRLFGDAQIVALIAQVLLGLGVVLLVYRIGSRTFGATAGLAAAALAAAYRPFSFFETKLVSATLAVFLVCLLIERLQAADASPRAVNWLPAGLVIGMACITRSNLLLLVPAVVLWIHLDSARPLRDRATRTLVMLVGLLVVVAPVTVRNHRVSGEFAVVSTNAGVNFYAGNNERAIGLFSAGEMSGVIHRQRAESRRIAEVDANRPLSDSEVSGFWLRKGVSLAREQPWRWIVLELRKAFLALDDYEHGLNYSPEQDRNPFRWLFPFSFAWILGLAALRSFAGRSLSRLEWPLIFILAVEVLTLLLFFVNSRFRLPMMAPGIVYAGFGAVVLIDRLRARKAWMPLLAAAVLATVSVVKLPPNGTSLYRKLSVVGESDRGVALLVNGRTDEAVVALEEAVKRDPDYPPARVDLAKAYRTVEDFVGAERSLLAAIETDPDHPGAHAALGGLYREQRRLDDATNHLRQALAGNPEDSLSAGQLLEILARGGRVHEATALLAQMKQAGMPVSPELERWILAREGSGRE
jgi:4-amino-4-deoxy-L-arabinose transferase-like glycosyltransferase